MARPTEPVPIIVFDELDSTNIEGRRRIERGETTEAWLWARRQTAGVGRRGRAWSSGEGDLTCTRILYTEEKPELLGQLSFVTAVATADAMEQWLEPATIQFKWPNDIFVDGRKAVGILLELVKQGDEQFILIGVGVNIRHAPDIETATARLARSDRGDHPTPEAVLSRLADAFERRLQDWRDNGFASTRAAWLGRAYGLGEIATARLGDRSIEGIFRDLDTDGACLMELGDGEMRRISAGDVYFGAAQAR